MPHSSFDRIHKTMIYRKKLKDTVRGGGQVVIVFALYSDDLSSNCMKSAIFLLNFLMKINKNRLGLVYLKISLRIPETKETREGGKLVQFNICRSDFYKNSDVLERK